MEPIDDDTTVGDLFERAQALAEQAVPVVDNCYALAEAAKFGIFVLLQGGDVDGYDWLEHVTKPIDKLELDDEGELVDYRRTEAVLMSQLIAIRQGLAANGTPMPEAPSALIAAIGRNP